MKTTAAVLAELQDYYASLNPRPSIKEIARIADMPYATTARHLNGTTRQGIPSRVRALCIAMNRQDLADEVIAETPTKNQDAWWIVELEKEWWEKNQEELNRVRADRDQTERRLLGEVERVTASKDKSIDLLMKRVDQLEKDKAELVTDKAEIMAELKHARKGKRMYEAVILLLVVAFAVYFIVFDLPYPDSGITEALINIFK